MAVAAEVTSLSIIIPVLNEADGIIATLEDLQAMRARGHEILVVDGGSTDETIALASPLADKVISSARGRAAQMQSGADHAHGDVLWFVHADTRVPVDADRYLLDGLAGSGRAWGRFDAALSGMSGIRFIARGMNLRSRLSGIATGDQAIFVRRETFLRIGGFEQIPLMEDIALSRALRRISRPVCLRQAVHTSARRWQQHGLLRTVLTMWLLRLGYFAGVSPQRLARSYPAHKA